MKIADPIKVIGGNLLVRSIKTERECQNEGFMYKWKINPFSFNKNKRDTCEKLGLSDQEFKYWKESLSIRHC